MRFYEELDHMLRQYRYRRKRNSTKSKNINNFDIEEFLDEVETCVGEVMEEIDRIIRR